VKRNAVALGDSGSAGILRARRARVNAEPHDMGISAELSTRPWGKLGRFGLYCRISLGPARANPYMGAVMAKNIDPNYKVIAENRRARYDYAIEDDLECGIMLMGSEVKSLRTGKSQITESYASVEDGELWLINSYIAPYDPAKTWGHEERRKRKLLVSRKELSRLWQAVSREGMTLIPLVMYFNHRGIVKLKIAIAKGKKVHDKRATEQKRDWNRQKARLLRQNS